MKSTRLIALSLVAGFLLLLSSLIGQDVFARLAGPQETDSQLQQQEDVEQESPGKKIPEGVDVYMGRRVAQTLSLIHI